MTQYYFEVPNKSEKKTQDQIFVGTEEQLKWLREVLLEKGILSQEAEPEILPVDERVNGLLEQYRGENGDGGIRRKKLPHYSVYNKDSEFGKILRSRDDGITLLYVSLQDRVNWGQLIIPNGGGIKFDDAIKEHLNIPQDRKIYEFGGMAGSEAELTAIGTKLNFVSTNASIMLALTLEGEITSFAALYNENPQANGSNPMVAKFADPKGIGEKKWKLGEDFIVIFGNPYVLYENKGAAIEVYVVAINEEMRRNGIPQGEITIDNERFYAVSSPEQKWKPEYEEYMNRAGAKLAEARGEIIPNHNMAKGDGIRR